MMPGRRFLRGLCGSHFVCRPIGNVKIALDWISHCRATGLWPYILLVPAGNFDPVVSLIVFMVGSGVSNFNSLSNEWLKAELHAHCSEDPRDYRVCNYTSKQLIFEASRLGYQVLAITCHNRDIWTRELSDYAEGLGITLIPGMEVDAEGKHHVLAYNFQTGCENLNGLAKLRARTRKDTLVIAPHSFFPASSCLRSLLLSHIDVFDAIELSGFHTSRLDFNRRARRIALEYQKPLVGNADVHMLWQLGKTFTWINSKPGILPVIEAIRQGKVRAETAPLSLGQVAGWWATTAIRYIFPVNLKPCGLRVMPSSKSIFEDSR
jgi:predicted metal-dependent phosphoesterase TrpH